MSNAILRLKDVLSRTGLSKSTIYDYVARKLFPPPLKLGARSIGWRESDITKWLDSLEQAVYE